MKNVFCLSLLIFSWLSLPVLSMEDSPSTTGNLRRAVAESPQIEENSRNNIKREEPSLPESSSNSCVLSSIPLAKVVSENDFADTQGPQSVENESPSDNSQTMTSRSNKRKKTNNHHQVTKEIRLRKQTLSLQMKKIN